MSMVKRGLMITGSVLAVAAVGTVVFFLLTNRGKDIPVIGDTLANETCPLTGIEPRNESVLDRPAVAVKIENSPVAYPLSGIEDAELVYEEAVEGGLTRFMAIYHCSDTNQAGPIRSAREVDPAIMTPTTRILGFSGSNAAVEKALKDADIVAIDEDNADGALERIERSGISFEHTLYANTEKLRKLGEKRYEDAPPDLFEFGDLPDGGERTRKIRIDFTTATHVKYKWRKDQWMRYDNDEPSMTDGGDQIGVDNVIIEEHTINFSEITDVSGNPSTEIADVTGEGRAVLFRDGQAFVGKWIRESTDDGVAFETRDGDALVLAPGSTWIELVPNQKGELKGSFKF